MPYVSRTDATGAAMQPFYIGEHAAKAAIDDFEAGYKHMGTDHWSLNTTPTPSPPATPATRRTRSPSQSSSAGPPTVEVYVSDDSGYHLADENSAVQGAIDPRLLEISRPDEADFDDYMNYWQGPPRQFWEYIDTDADTNHADHDKFFGDTRRRLYDTGAFSPPRKHYGGMGGTRHDLVLPVDKRAYVYPRGHGIYNTAECRRRRGGSPCRARVARAPQETTERWERRRQEKGWRRLRRGVPGIEIFELAVPVTGDSESEEEEEEEEPLVGLEDYEESDGEVD